MPKILPYEVSWSGSFFAHGVGMRDKSAILANVAARRIAQQLYADGVIKESEYGLACVVIERAIPYIPHEAQLAEEVEVKYEKAHGEG